MNEIIEAMKQRRSCRAFRPDAVPQTLLAQIAEDCMRQAAGTGRLHASSPSPTRSSVTVSPSRTE